MDGSSETASLERLPSEELGIGAEARAPFRFTPGRIWTPLVISFPHVGLGWPHDLRPKPQVDFARNADFAVETLYDGASELGAAKLEAIYSRLAVDLNRAPNDVPPGLIPDHPNPQPRERPGAPAARLGDGHRRPARGVVWDMAVGNIPILEGPLPYESFRRRIERYYQPYYRALEVLLERRRARFGHAVLLDAHSMPSTVGVDLVLGDLDGRSCSAPLRDAALDALRRGRPQQPADAVLSLRVNDPYRGGELVRRFGRPEADIHALQLEVSRGLYMDERAGRLRPPLPDGSSTAAFDADDSRPEDPPGRAAYSRRAARHARRLDALLGGIRSLIRVLADPTADFQGVARAADEERPNT